ncbi:hypothetical protein [Janthinobacterium psychrotolerans]|uniref:hypothetical protein n=1 Tax=Janthinobacterium psychrotolerans TaxID=1747903 RepID=UPI0012372838|nr:hypothetical protein [Janthinobacterium psychrotolerans]
MYTVRRVQGLDGIPDGIRRDKSLFLLAFPSFGNAGMVDGTFAGFRAIHALEAASKIACKLLILLIISLV